MTCYPIGDRVLVALPPREDETVSAGGIVLVKDPDRFHAPTRGIVMALGVKSNDMNRDDVLSRLAEVQRDGAFTYDTVTKMLVEFMPARFDVEEGDCVIFPQSAGEEFSDGGIDYVILREAEIIGVVEPFQKENAA